MDKKLKQIGIIGPNRSLCSEELFEFGINLGKNIAVPDRIFISGGKGGFMEAVFKGVKSSKNTFAGQTIGILPEENKTEANQYTDIVIPTGMGIARNIIIINSSEIVIAAGGGAGTLSELAFAWQKGKTVLCITAFGGWSKELAGKTIDNRFNKLFLETNSINDIKHFLDNI